MLFIAGAIALVVISGIASSYVIFRGTQPLSVMLALVAAITYFGTLSIPGGGTKDEAITEGRIRLALASTFVIVYLVYLSTAIFWTVPGGAEQTLAGPLVETLTDLIKIVLPFYFGVSGAVEIAKSRSRVRTGEADSASADQPKGQS